MGNENRSTTPQSATFKDFISSGWAERPEPRPAPRSQAPFAADRRARISAMHVGERLSAEGHGWLVSYDYAAQRPGPIAPRSVS